MKIKNIPVTPVATVFGMLLAAVVWLALYAGRAGSIEFDGPAVLGMGIVLVVGGLIGGISGIIYDRRRKRRLFKSLLFFIAAFVASFLVVGMSLGSYAQRTWGLELGDDTCNMLQPQYRVSDVGSACVEPAEQ